MNVDGATKPKAPPRKSARPLVMPGTFRDLARLPRAVKQAYSFDFLTKELPKIANSRTADAVFEEHFRFFADVSNYSPPGRIMTTIGTPGSEGKLKVSTGDLHQFRAFIQWYRKNGKSAHAELIAAHQGNFSLSNQLQPTPDGKWEHYVDHVFAPYGIKVSAVVNYSLPFHRNLRLGMYYAFFDRHDRIASRFEFDYLTLPFAIVWLYRFDVIDEETLRHWLFLLVGLSPTNLFLIREVLSTPRYHASLPTLRTGLSKRNAESKFYQLADLLNEKFPRDANMTGNGSILFDIAHHYGFLSLTGRPHFQVNSESKKAKT